MLRRCSEHDPLVIRRKGYSLFCLKIKNVQPTGVSRTFQKKMISKKTI